MPQYPGKKYDPRAPLNRARNAWRKARLRCENPHDASFTNYGGRGITFSAEWHDFAAFYAHMGPPPDGTTLDRIDNSKGYGPGNCRWTTPQVQSANRRPAIWSEADIRRIALRSVKGWRADKIADDLGIRASFVRNVMHMRTWALVYVREFRAAQALLAA